MLNKIIKLFSLLSAIQKKYLLFFLLFATISSFMEIISIGSIIYFVNYINRSSLDSFQNKFDDNLNSFANGFNIDPTMFLGILVIILLMSSSLLIISSHFVSAYLSSKVTSQFSENLMGYYLNRNYLSHVDDESSRILNNINSISWSIGNEILQPLMNLISRVFFIIPILIGVFIYNFKISIFGFIAFSFFYFIIFMSFKKIMAVNGRINSINGKNKINIIEDFIGLFQEVKINNSSKYYLDKFKIYNKIHVKINYITSLISNSPKNLIELIAFSTVIILILYYYKQDNFNFILFAETMSVFVICAYKLLPSFQQIYTSLLTIKGGISAFELIEKDLESANRIKQNFINKNKVKKLTSIEIIKNNSKISLKNISFSYKDSYFIGLNNINIDFNIGEKIALFGISGSGKSTLINIISGLIKSDSGQISVDNQKISDEDLINYRKKISIVPQEIYLVNGSIEDNIILDSGLDKNLNKGRINEAIQLSQLNEVLDNLNKRENKFVGDKGMHLSGGQKQRVAIARSILKDSKIIIFDESTNSLDNLTELEIVNSFGKFAKNSTVFMITHNLNLLNKFDKIIFLENGSISGYDNFDQLVKTNLNFSKLQETYKLKKKQKII